MMDQIQELTKSLGKRFHNLNPSLTEYPPPIHPQHGKVCYLGADGNDDWDQVTYCKDLPVDVVDAVPSWYISPERHVVESIIITLVATIVIYILLPPLLVQNKRVPVKNRDLPNVRIRILSLLAFLLQTNYKMTGYEGKIYSMLLPCNMLWIFSLVLCFLPSSKSSQTNAQKPAYKYLNLNQSAIIEIIIQLWCGYIALPITALAEPDTTDSIQCGEVYFFFAHHTLLILYPYYYLGTGRTSLSLRRYSILQHIQWWLVTCAFFAAFYFGVIAPLGISVGLNLNYMVNPPGGTPLAEPELRSNYRLWSIVGCGIMFGIMRISLGMMEYAMELMMGAVERLTLAADNDRDSDSDKKNKLE
eukprot:983585_1